MINKVFLSPTSQIPRALLSQVSKMEARQNPSVNGLESFTAVHQLSLHWQWVWFGYHPRGPQAAVVGGSELLGRKASDDMKSSLSPVH